MTRNELEPLLTVAEVAELLRLTPKTIRNKAYRGELPRAPLHGALRFRRGDIERLMGLPGPVGPAADAA